MHITLRHILSWKVGSQVKDRRQRSVTAKNTACVLPFPWHEPRTDRQTSLTDPTFFPTIPTQGF